MKKLAIWVVCGIFILTGCQKQVLIIAHRGASYRAPENTRAAAELGWQLGADGVEVDVYLSQDGQIVVIHDKTTKRTAGVDLVVAETSAAELQKLDVGKWKDISYAGETIPLLSEIIAMIPAGRILFVEVKCGPEIIPELERVVSESGKADQIVIISFNLEVVTEAKKVMPTIPAYWLRGTYKDEKTKQQIPHDPAWVETVIAREVDGLNLHYGGMDERFVWAVKAAGQDYFVWTVNDADVARWMVAMGVSGITTDRPGWLREQLK